VSLVLSHIKKAKDIWNVLRMESDYYKEYLANKKKLKKYYKKMKDKKTQKAMSIFSYLMTDISSYKDIRDWEDDLVEDLWDTKEYKTSNNKKK